MSSTTDKFSSGDIARSMPEQSQTVTDALANRAQSSTKFVTPSVLKTLLPQQSEPVAEKNTTIKPALKDNSENKEKNSLNQSEVTKPEPDRESLSMPSELTPDQQSLWDKKMGEASEILTPSELKNTLQDTLQEKPSDKMQMVDAVASSYLDKNVPPEMREAVANAIAKQAQTLEKDGNLSTPSMYDHNAPSQNQTEKSIPSIDLESERSR